MKLRAAWLIALVSVVASPTHAQPPTDQGQDNADPDPDPDQDQDQDQDQDNADPDPDPDPDPDQDPDPDPDLLPRTRGKLAIIVAGDPDEALQRAARALEDTLRDRVALPSDPGLRAALRGAPGQEDDGLARVRRERRGLGFGDEDLPTLARLGRLAGADAVAVLRRADGRLQLEILDVGAATFYRDRLPLEPLGAAADFAVRATRAAHRRAGGPAVDVTPATVAANGAETEEEPEDPLPPARAWLKKNWAYIVGGVLLVGVATFFIVRARRDDGPPNPVLRFRTGLE